MTVEEHDEICAMTSHLPHILSNCFVSAVLSSRKDLPRYAGPSFEDWVRIAGSSPRMWRDIFITNRDKILEAIYLFQKDLDKMTEIIKRSDEEELLSLLQGIAHLKEESIAGISHRR